MANGIRKFLVEFITDASKAVEDFNAAGESLKKVRQELKGTDKEFDVFSVGVWGTAAAVQAFTGGMVWSATSVETAMAKTGTALEYAGTSAGDMGKQFLDAGKDASALLPVAEFAAKLGMKGSADIAEFTKTAETMGYAFGISAQSAGESLSKIGAATGKTNEELALLASGMVALSNRALVSRSSLEMVVLRTADVAKAAGVSEAPIMALAAAFEQKGIKARMAIQPISKMVELLGKGRIPGIKLARAIGLSGEKLEEWKKMKPEERMALFTSELAKMKPEKAAKKLEHLKISSGRYAKQIVGALQDTKKFNEMMGIAAKGMEDTTALEKEAADNKATLTIRIKDMWTALKTVGQGIGLQIIPVVTLFIQGLTFLIGILKKIPTSVLTVLVVVGWLLSSLVLLSKVIMMAGVISVGKSIAALLIWAAVQLGVTEATKLQSGEIYKNAAAQMVATKATYTQIIAALRLIPAMMKQVLVLGWSAIAYAAELFWRKLHIKAIWQEFYACLAQTAAAAKELIVLAAIGVKTVVVTIATWAYVVASLALKIAQGGLVGAGSSLVRGLGALIPMLLGTAAATWAAVAPILVYVGIVLAVVAAIVALIIIVKVVTDWMMTWGKTAKTLALIFGLFISPIIWTVFVIRLLIKHWDELVASMKKVSFWLKNISKILFIMSPQIWLMISLVKLLTKLFAGSGLEEAIQIVVGALKDLLKILGIIKSAFISVLSAPFNLLQQLTTKIFGMGSAIGNFVSLVFNPLNSLRYILEKIAKAVAFVKGLLFSSSMLYIKEGVTEVLPSLNNLVDRFENLGDVMRKARGLPPAPPIPLLPVGTAATVGRAVAGAAAPRAAAASVAAAGAAGAGAGGAGGGGGGEVRIVIPVTVELDGMILARVVAEHLSGIGSERNMRESRFPLRGVEPAY